MEEIFGHVQKTKFNTFSPAHFGFIIGLIIIAVLIIVLTKNKTEKQRRIFRYCFAGALFLIEISHHIWKLAGGIYDITRNLPIHLCGVIIFLAIIMLINKNQTLYEIVYFLGIGGAMQAIITPDTLYNFPHWIVFQAFLAHGGIVISALYMTFVEDMRPKSAFSLLKIALLANIYVVAVYFLNVALDANYMLLMGPLENPTLVNLLVDIFGKPPAHIIGLELIGAVTVLILYAPWFVKNMVEKYSTDTQKDKDSVFVKQ
jgi:hypothetical integral membrane protein (TIGR02206 family)